MGAFVGVVVKALAGDQCAGTVDKVSNTAVTVIEVIAGVGGVGRLRYYVVTEGIEDLITVVIGFQRLRIAGRIIRIDQILRGNSALDGFDTDAGWVVLVADCSAAIDRCQFHSVAVIVGVGQVGVIALIYES